LRTTPSRPLYSLRRSGAQVAVAKSTKTFGMDLGHFGELSHDRLDYIVLSHLECHGLRVAGQRNCRGYLRAGWIAHSRRGTERRGPRGRHLGVDALTAPGHKGRYAPMGTSALVLSAPLSVRPVRQGGTGFKSENPEQPEETLATRGGGSCRQIRRRKRPSQRSRPTSRGCWQAAAD
jgi:cysteine desulfurase / selenocysteine lyase